MQDHLAISVVERKALNLASDQIAARDELQGKKKHQYEYGKSKRSRLCELQRSGSIFQRLAHISENLELKTI